MSVLERIFGSGRRGRGKRGRTYIVAEISANHGKDLRRALKMIRAAKEAGADAVKFQAYTPDTLTIDVDNRYFRIRHRKWGGRTLYQLYREASTPLGWFEKLKRAADAQGIVFFATAYDTTSVDLLDDLGVPVHKIASPEMVDLGLIEYAARRKKPLLLSTGMATLEEIEEAVDTARGAGAKELVLLRCVSSYPALPEDMNLKTIPDLKERFRCPVGLSDHTLGIGVALAAVTLGADLIEKHLTLSRSSATPDSFFSIEPRELKELVENTRIVEKAQGEAKYGPAREERKSRLYRRSLFVVRDIRRGEVFTAENVRSIRPAYGLPPKCFKDVLGRRASRNIHPGTPLRWDLIQ